MNPFTSHSHRVRPLGPMPELRLERAPILTPEYRGVTPRASLERARRRYAAIQVAALERVTEPAPTRYAMSDHEFSESRRAGHGWTLASAALILLVVVLACCASHVRLW